MTSSEQHSPPERDSSEADIKASSPGKMIEQARENAKLSQADLAQRLRLDTKYIRHLELDNFEQLPGPTFIKGYLRSVAKELGMRTEPLLEAYRRVSKTEREPTLADFESRPPPQISSNSFIVKAGSYALAITLVLLLIFWWQSNEVTIPDNDDSSASTDDAYTSTPLPYEFSQVIHDDDPFFVNPLAEQNRPDDMSPPQDAGDQDADTKGGVANDDGTIELSLSTSAESWVEIYDVDGKQLYFGMANTRVPITVRSKKSLDLLIGNTPTVELKINGQQVDLTPLSKDGVAKFKYP